MMGRVSKAEMMGSLKGASKLGISHLSGSGNAAAS